MSAASPRENEFDAQEYWDARLKESYHLGGVGWLGLGRGLNSWAYRVRRRGFMRAVASTGGEAGDVLDIGSGTGFYLDLWSELGARSVVGTDLTPTAVRELSRAYPEVRIERVDIGSEGADPDGGPFDWISIMDVLFHVVDDERYERALSNIHSLLRPGGHVVLSDFFATERVQRSDHVVARSSSETEAAICGVGLEIVYRRPLLVLLSDSPDRSWRWQRRWWRTLSRTARRSPRAGSALAAAAYPVESLLTRSLRRGPSTNLVVCRRPA